MKNKKNRRWLVGIILLHISFGQLSYAQQYLIDSISLELKKEQTPLQTIDLHLGITRAADFIGNTALREKHGAIAITLSKKHKTTIGLVAALLLKSNQLAVIQQALSIAQKNKDKQASIFATYRLGEYYIYNRNYPKAASILNTILKNVDAKTPSQITGNIHKNLGLANFHQGKNDTALKHFNTASNYFNQLKTNPIKIPELGRPSAMGWDKGSMNLGQTLIYLSWTYTQMGLHKKALTAAQKAKRVYETSRTPLRVGRAIEAIARVNHYKGSLEKAIKNYQEAIIIYEQTASTVDLKRIHHTIGLLFYQIGELNAAKNSFKKGIAYSQTIKDTLQIILYNSALGMVAKTQGQPEEALVYHQEALRINQMVNDSTQLASLLTVLADLYLETGQVDQANKHYHTALALAKSFNQQDGILNILIRLTTNFESINQLDSAKYYGKIAMAKASQNSSSENEIALAAVMSNIYEKSADFEQALIYQKKYVELLQKNNNQRTTALLQNEQVRQNIAGVRAEKRKVERQADLLASSNQLFLAILTSLGLFFILGVYFFYQLRTTKSQIETQNSQLQTLNENKDRLFSIIAHDIRSPITALDSVGQQISYYLKKNDTKKLAILTDGIESTAKNLTSLLDNLLNWALLQKGSLPYHPEHIKVKEIVQENVDLYKEVAIIKSISLHNETNDTISVYADNSALSTILRNLINNAIKYTPSGGQIFISCEQKKKQVHIKVRDTGLGMETEKLNLLFTMRSKKKRGTAGEKGTGLGLLLCQDLVKMNKGSIKVTSELGKGTQFVVILPQK